MNESPGCGRESTVDESLLTGNIPDSGHKMRSTHKTPSHAITLLPDESCDPVPDSMLPLRAKTRRVTDIQM